MQDISEIQALVLSRTAAREVEARAVLAKSPARWPALVAWAFPTLVVLMFGEQLGRFYGFSPGAMMLLSQIFGGLLAAFGYIAILKKRVSSLVVLMQSTAEAPE